jgi:predicted nicotinamide N-methyase
MPGLDFVLANTRPRPVPLVPEIVLRQTDADPFTLWEQAGGDVPYWAFAWVGGQALARHVLDHPACVAGRRVLDLASGSGLVALAAALAGAAAVTAVDVDPLAILAIGVNAAANGVTVTAIKADILDSDAGDADIVLAGDVCYDVDLAARVVPFLTRVPADVLLGDPGRGYVPTTGFTKLATYPVPVTKVLEGRDTTPTTVWRRERTVG